MAEIDTIAARIQVHALAAGAKLAPTQPPDQASVYPFSAVYPGGATWTSQSAGWVKGLETIICEIHVQRRNLALDVATLNAFAWDIPERIWGDPTLNGNVDTVIEVRRSALLPMAWAGTDTIGYRFEIDFKVEPTI